MIVCNKHARVHNARPSLEGLGAPDSGLGPLRATVLDFCVYSGGLSAPPPTVIDFGSAWLPH